MADGDGQGKALAQMAEGADGENARLRSMLDNVRAECAAMQRFLDTSALAITHFRRDGTILFINRTGASNLGGAPSQFEGKNILTLVPELADQTRARIEHTLDRGEPVSVETAVKLPAGERWFRSTYFPVYDDQQRPMSVQLVSQDITELKRVEQLLEATEGRLATVLEHAPHLIAIIDRDGVVRYINRAPRGLSVEQIIGSGPNVHLPIESAHLLRQSLERVLETAQPDMIEVEALSGRHWELRLAPVMRHGQVHQLLGFAVDISERRQAAERERQLEVQVQRAQKLESLGVLAGGIAHDFNNLLVGILGNAQLAMASETSASVRGHLRDVVHGAQRAAELCRQMLAYAGRGQLTLGGVDVSKLSEEILELVRARLSKRARLVVNCPADLPLVEGDASQLRQVVMNLLTNASDALDGRDGEITLLCHLMQRGESDRDGHWIHEPPAPGRYICVEVRDTGIGMDAETRRRMFDPFFTTKQLGSGLGLAAVLGIVRRHGGAISVDSEPGRGTTIRVALPAAARSLEASSVGEPPVAVSGSGTILVVDDEPIVRSVARKVLEGAGHRVVLSADGVEALSRYDANPAEIDAVLLDLSMPRMDGLQTLEQLRARDPRLPVVLASGFNASEGERARWIDDPATDFIAKPYDVNGLLAALQRAMSSRPKHRG